LEQGRSMVTMRTEDVNSCIVDICAEGFEAEQSASGGLVEPNADGSLLHATASSSAGDPPALTAANRIAVARSSSVATVGAPWIAVTG
jgi:hypothetical protein